MKFESKPSFNPLKITLESPEEVYRMMSIMQFWMSPANQRDYPDRYTFAACVEHASREHYNTEDKKV